MRLSPRRSSGGPSFQIRLRLPDGAARASAMAARPRRGESFGTPESRTPPLESPAGGVLNVGGRAGEIRTHDLLRPMQARYQAAPRPDTGRVIAASSQERKQENRVFEGFLRAPFKNPSKRKRRPPLMERTACEISVNFRIPLRISGFPREILNPETTQALRPSCAIRGAPAEREPLRRPSAPLRAACAIPPRRVRSAPPAKKASAAGERPKRPRRRP